MKENTHRQSLGPNSSSVFGQYASCLLLSGSSVFQPVVILESMWRTTKAKKRQVVLGIGVKKLLHIQQYMRATTLLIYPSPTIEYHKQLCNEHLNRVSPLDDYIPYIQHQ